MSATPCSNAGTGVSSPRRLAPPVAAVTVLLVLLALLCVVPRPTNALNTCEEITRCSECVYDQTQGIMPPPLLCGWCESSHSCKEVNSTVLSYYGATLSPSPSTGDNDDDGQPVPTHSPEEMAAFRAAFCEDLRERDLNGVCPDMSCAAARTTNNIYICRPPPLIALVVGCLLFVVTVAMYVWMRTIRQLPWKYEPFLSDLLEGRTRAYEAEGEERRDHDNAAEEETAAAAAAAATVGAAEIGNTNSSSRSRHENSIDDASGASPVRRVRTGPLHTAYSSSPLRDGPPPPLPLLSPPPPPPPSSPHIINNDVDDDDDDDAPSTETASTVSNPSYLGNVSHNVVVAHHPHVAVAGGASMGVSFAAAAAAATAHPSTALAPAAAAAAATGYCPICKCRQPVSLGPGEVCFWCNVARFSFVPFSIALISAVFVIVLDFAVSLKPWFSDWYFAEVLVIAYASYGALGAYMVHHHGRAPLFFFESEAERRANQKIWSTTHDRPAAATAVFLPGVPPCDAPNNRDSNNNSSGGGHDGLSTGSPSRRGRTTAAAAAAPMTAAGFLFTQDAGGGVAQHDHRRSADNQRLRLLNDARRNMASTYYFQLALQLRGRALLTCMPELKKYTAQLESMQASPATLAAVGDAVAVMRPAASAVATGSRVGSTPGSPHGAKLTNNNSNVSAAALAEHRSARLAHAPIISPFAAAVPLLESAGAAAVDPSSNDAAAAADAVAPAESPNGAVGASPASASSPSLSSGFENSRLPPLAHVAATPPPPPPPRRVVSGSNNASTATKPVEAAPNPSAAAAMVQASSPLPPPPPAPATPPVAPAGGPIGSPAATNIPESLARQKRGETVQLLSSDFLSPQYARSLKGALYRDEYILWCAKPNLHGVLMKNEWLLLDLAAGFLFGLWMVVLSSVSDKTYAIVQLCGSAAVAACGWIAMILFAVLLVIVVRQCGRLYVLTNERLITVYESVITPVTTATDLSTVRFAALYGYRSLWSKHPCLTFSWEVPATERKMPVIKSHAFPGITQLQEFLFFFCLVAPQTPFHLEQISESAKQDRQEWRLHMCLCIGAFVALPIVTIYPQAMPDFLAVFLYVLGLLLIYATLLRGFCAQQMTYVPLNIAASWAPEGELAELHAVNAARSLSHTPSPPPPPPPPPPPTSSAPHPAPSPPSTSPTTLPQQQQQTAAAPFLKEGGGGDGGHTVQVATPPTLSPILRGQPDQSRDAHPAVTSAAAPHLTDASTTAGEPVPLAGTATTRSTAGSRTQPANGGGPFPSISAGPLPPQSAKPLAIPTTAAAAVSGSSGGGGGGDSSASNAKANAIAALHSTSNNSYTPTCTASSTPCTTPTSVGLSSALLATPSSLSKARPTGSPQEHAHDDVPQLYAPSSSYQLRMRRSESDEAVSARRGAATSAADVGHLVKRSDSTHRGGGDGLAASMKGSRRASLVHVVPASARSTKPDGHTTWGDQVEEQGQ
ncbi:hypothetical protein ABB37_08920 [Leptomonas pyrrhocoris]|uniref:Integral membrane protein n=1 Tax=Leptomonas pyrrhocoris TaxID=157538 RepID=A0A0N0DRP4_LEPPY|nr:hypothetical protein ABB37_08920 [Leptomonas pyrrhocoris]KPA74938.1 hypothetical protein ABB37_08920 [Leptomonas pyrrhocoris]|eukprot:XP_015653377.1 hypothetical protein ABB37_08920 [Leptomonas pyrrhocoris]